MKRKDDSVFETLHYYTEDLSSVFSFTSSSQCNFVDKSLKLKTTAWSVL